MVLRRFWGHREQDSGSPAFQCQLASPSCAISRSAITFAVEIFSFRLTAAARTKRHVLKFILFGLSWREKAAGLNGEGIGVLWMGHREGFQQASRFFFVGVGLLSEAD